MDVPPKTLEHLEAFVLDPFLEGIHDESVLEPWEPLESDILTMPFTICSNRPCLVPQSAADTGIVSPNTPESLLNTSL